MDHQSCLPYDHTSQIRWQTDLRSTIQWSLQSDTYTYLSTIWRADGPPFPFWPSTRKKKPLESITCTLLLWSSATYIFPALSNLTSCGRLPLPCEPMDRMKLSPGQTPEHDGYYDHIRRLDCHVASVTPRGSWNFPSLLPLWPTHLISSPLLLNFCSLCSLLT